MYFDILFFTNDRSFSEGLENPEKNLDQLF